MDAIEKLRSEFIADFFPELDAGTSHLDREEHEARFFFHHEKWNVLWGDPFSRFDRAIFISAHHPQVWAWLNRGSYSHVVNRRGVTDPMPTLWRALMDEEYHGYLMGVIGGGPK